VCNAPNRIVKKKVAVKAPASVANLGPGFDVLAVAIEGLYDIVEVSLTTGSGKVYVTSQGFDIPSGEGNVAYHIARHFMEKHSISNHDLYIVVKKGVPPASGLGSSGATCAATAFALNVLFDAGLEEEALLKLAGIGEAFAAGSPHYDNVAASLFGGLVILDLVHGKVFKYVPKRRIPIAIVMPKLKNLTAIRKTEYARSILPKHISLEVHIKQSSALAKLLYGILTEDLKVFGEAISTDYVVEPCRASIIPFYSEMKKLALSEGAYGFNISGAGPSVFIVHEDVVAVARIGEKVKSLLNERGVEAHAFVSYVSPKGAEVVEVVE